MIRLGAVLLGAVLGVIFCIVWYGGAALGLWMVGC